MRKQKEQRLHITEMKMLLGGRGNTRKELKMEKSEELQIVHVSIKLVLGQKRLVWYVMRKEEIRKKNMYVGDEKKTQRTSNDETI